MQNVILDIDRREDRLIKQFERAKVERKAKHAEARREPQKSDPKQVSTDEVMTSNSCRAHLSLKHDAYPSSQRMITAHTRETSGDIEVDEKFHDIRIELSQST